MEQIGEETEQVTQAHGQRGPADHERRQQIIAVANEHFRNYGYSKTTIADLAKAINLSSAYIYKFFESKQAVGEAICRQCLGRIEAELHAIANEPKPAADRMRRLFQSLVKQSSQLFFKERKMYDTVLYSSREGWKSTETHESEVLAVIRQIVVDGRNSGEFERKTPLDETCRAIRLALRSVADPLLLERNLDTAEEDATAVANLVLRSLAS
jgi:AcrR family transcriptional regulator